MLLLRKRKDAQKIIKAIAEGDLDNIRAAVVQAMGGIHQAFGGDQSHWFECVNGHPYYIDACGGAARVPMTGTVYIPPGILAPNAAGGQLIPLL